MALDDPNPLILDCPGPELASGIRSNSMMLLVTPGTSMPKNPLLCRRIWAGGFQTDSRGLRHTHFRGLQVVCFRRLEAGAIG
jgi:hypothetical protein